MKKILILIALSTGAIHFAVSQDNSEIPDQKQRNHIVKFHLFSPYSNRLTFGYEKLLANNLSIESKVGIAGVGIENPFYADDSYKKNAGLTFRTGAKFKFRRNEVKEGKMDRQELSGTYCKPEIGLSFLSRSFHKYSYSYDYHEREEITVNEAGLTGAFILNIGKQWILHSRLVVDVSFGGGWGFSSLRSMNGRIDEADGSSNFFGFYYFGKSLPLVTSSNFAIGYAF